MSKKKNILILIFLILGILMFIFLVYCFFPIITHDYSANKPNRIYLTDRSGIVITDKPNEFGYRIVGNENIHSSQVVQDLIQIEDKNYYSHFGINVLSKLRALFGNIKAGEITSGGSTITEQYIKNEFFQKEKRTYLQKAREAVVAFFLPPLSSVFGERGLGGESSKNQILNSYLNNVYFGNNVYGIQTAIEVFFGKTDLNNLTDEEIVLLISLLHTPSANLESKEFERYFNQVKERLGYDFERTIFKLPKPPSVDKFPFVSGEI